MLLRNAGLLLILRLDDAMRPGAQVDIGSLLSAALDKNLGRGLLTMTPAVIV
jgi:hypothetical protein